MSATQHDEFRPFEVEVRLDGAGVRVAPHGEIDIATADRLQARIAELLAGGCTRLVLDLEGVRFMDSTGIRLLVELTRSARDDHWELAVIRVPHAVRRVLELSGVLDAVPLEQETT